MVAKKKINKPKKSAKLSKSVKKSKSKEKAKTTKLTPPGSKQSNVSEISISAGKVNAKLNNVRIDFVHLKAPRKNNFDDYQYGLRLGFFGDLLSALYDPIKEAIESGSPKKWTKDKWVSLDQKEIERLRKSALDKLEEKLSTEGTDHFAEAYVLNANAKAKHLGGNLYEPKTKIFIAPSVDKFYSGCWADVAVTFSFHANDGGGITIYLNGVRFVGDDTDLGANQVSNMWDEEASEVEASEVSEEDSESSESSNEPESEEPQAAESEPKTKTKRFWG